MAESGEQYTLTAKADADLSAAQHHIVRLTGALTTNIASHATNSAMAGVLQNKPAAANRGATIAYDGLSKVVAGGSVTVNAWLTCNGSGRATAAGSGDMVCGRALEAAGADGEKITALLYKPFRLSGAA